MKYYLQLFISVFIGATLLTSCAQYKQKLLSSENLKSTNIDVNRVGGGSSGMTQVDDNRYILVYDLKVFQDGNRLALLQIKEETLEVLPISVEHWDDEGPSSDLESICKIPGRVNEYLVAESGNWEGNFGRIFHLNIDTSSLSAQVLGRIKIPMLYRNDPTTTGDQYESMHCFQSSNGKFQLLLGERGGSVVNPHGVLRWAELDLSSYKLTFSEKGKQGLEVDVPGQWRNSESKRNMTDFYVDENDILWSAATEDPGDLGPFYSVIYQLGSLNTTSPEHPVNLEPIFWNRYEINGFKIEALSGPAANVENHLSFGTEDETLGGVWRPLLFPKK